MTEAQAEQAAGTLVSGLPAADRNALRPAVEAALRDGDVATALATVAPAAVSDRTRTAADRLRASVGGGTWNFTDTLDLAPLHRARTYTAVGLGLTEALSSALLVASLAVLWIGGGSATPGRRLLPVGWSLAAGGLLAGLVAVVFRLVSGGQVIDPPGSWPPSLARLVDDVQRTALDRLKATALTTALVPVLAGALLTGVGWALQVRPHVPALPRLRWLALATGGAPAAGVLLIPYAVTPTASRTCEGSADLCDRSYDEVAYLTSHNAMSTTVDRFIGPLQDPGITAQLDDGVRALQIDTYRWERPDEITARLAESDFTPEQRKFIAAAVNKVNPPHEGLWLCHSVCRAGAIALVPALREIGDWMRAHPTEVMTLIVQDAISGEDTQQAFAQAGLSDLVHTPDPDPAKPWPTLGDLIDSGRRLVVFAEQADGPAPWYRNFYDYGMETRSRSARRTPDAMSCVAHLVPHAGRRTR